MANRENFRQEVTTFGSNSMVIQRADQIVYTRNNDILQKIENPERFYVSPRPRPVLSDEVQESNIERKMKKFGDDEVVYAQRRRADILVVLQRMASLSEYSQEHLEWITRNLEDLYRQTYAAAVRVDRRASGIAYHAILERLDEFAYVYDHERLPLNRNVVLGLLYNATGLCDINWKIPGARRNGA